MTPTPKRARPSESITIEQEWTGQWIATLSSYDGPESPIGTGATPADALDMLLDQAGMAE
jgi:hypothetical protein